MSRCADADEEVRAGKLLCGSGPPIPSQSIGTVQVRTARQAPTHKVARWSWSPIALIVVDRRRHTLGTPRPTGAGLADGIRWPPFAQFPRMRSSAGGSGGVQG